MAKVLNPLNSSEARGRVGALVYNTWRGIRTVKSHTPPEHQDDPLRQAHKAIVQAAGQRWATISAAQRAAWNAYAQTHFDLDWTGAPKRIAGYHWYVRCQTRLIQADWAYSDWPPTAPCDFNLESLWADQEADYIALTWTPWYPDPLLTYKLQLWIAGPVSTGRTPTLHDARAVRYESIEYGEADFADLQDGDYVFWARPFKNNGTAAAFRWARCTFVNP